MCLLVDKSDENDVEMGGNSELGPNNRVSGLNQPGLRRGLLGFFGTVARANQLALESEVRCLYVSVALIYERASSSAPNWRS
jgi:hypothetical protein